MLYVLSMYQTPVSEIDGTMVTTLGETFDFQWSFQTSPLIYCVGLIMFSLY